MKYFFTLVIAILFFSAVSAQKLNIQFTLEKAIQQSVKTDKPILLIVSVPHMNAPLTSNGTKINFSSAIDDAEITEAINENFIAYKTIMSDTSIRSIMSKSAINSFPAYIFLRSNKEVFFKDYGNSTSKQRYLYMIENALKALKEKPISELEREYLANKSDNQLLKNLIDAKKKLGQNDNAELIEDYVKSLKIEDFNNYQTVLYILEAGPYTDGNAFKFAHTNRKIIDSIYRREPFAKRSAFNNFIINNTMSDAIKAKNLIKAQSAASFTRGTWTNDYMKGAKAYDTQMMRYYLAVKDTARYLQTATYHYDNYYMRIGADSIKKIEASDLKAMEKRGLPASLSQNIVLKDKMDSLMKAKGTNVITRSVVAVGPTSSSYANELNNAAYKFYETGTKNINHLTKAMIWSRRSIELNPISGYYDTLAHILYRLEYYEEAIKNQQLAIEKSKAENRDVKHLQEELKKMKARQI
ncbi:hypothetical protein [Pedobacter sp. Leaf176]|uniref:hypothetical protein n=1 Tax=Pedobacter sp. Leaf176 TaxID=1736286 RepID=UPI0007007575|nr:hypothetical protein [Pedobacter sp. Leaf176]KQR72572.1 hypothetical protein ASF92_04680 [Pedobacter sp. Leaf176]